MENLEDATILMKLIFDAISTDNSLDVSIWIKRIPLEKLDVDTSDTILNQFLTACVAANRHLIARIIFNEFVENNASEEVLPLLTYIFTKYRFSENLLAFMARVYPEITFFEHVTNLISFDQGPIVPIAMKRLLQIYGEQSFDTYKELLDVAREEQNDDMIDFLESKLDETAPFAERPPWVKNFVVWDLTGTLTYSDIPSGYLLARPRNRPEAPKADDLPYEDEIIVPPSDPIHIQLPSNEKATELLTEGLRELGFPPEDIEIAQDTIRSQLNISTVEEKYLLLEGFIKENIKLDRLTSDIARFRIFGPANPIFDVPLPEEEEDVEDPTSPSHEWESRMFTSTEFDRYDPDLEIVDDDVDWFTGNCDVCHLKIANRYWAIRAPRPHGSWEGVYCSKNCILADYSTNVPDIARDALVDRILDQLENFGIQDRLIRA